MKKTIRFFITVCLVLLACTLAFTACDSGNETQTPSDTTSGNVTTTGDATTDEPNVITSGDVTTDEPNVTTNGDVTTKEPDETTAPETEPHVHAFGEWKTVKLATCTEKGSEERICACGEKETQSIDIIAHTEVIDEAVAPTCTEDGKTEGKHCSVCNTITVAQETVKAKGHSFGEWKTVKAATCTEKGSEERVCACGEKETQSIDTIAHTEVIDEAVAPTCTENGKTEGKHCSVCNTITVAQETVKAKGHSFGEWKTVKEATCTESGSKEGICVCGQKETQAIDALGHTEIIDEAVAPTCTEDGKTEGKHCLVCNTITVEQTIVKTNGHAEVVDKAVSATCTENGLTEGKHCSVCNKVLVAQNEIPAIGHTEVIDAAVEPTCAETGLTEGKHCSSCHEVFVKQEIIESKGHTSVVDAAVEPTCTEPGLTEGYHCSVCNEVFEEQQIIEAIGHSEVVFPGRPATCTRRGYTESKQCSVCLLITVKREYFPMIDHTKGEWVEEVKATETTDGYKSLKCSVCSREIEGAVIYATGSVGLEYELDIENNTYILSGPGSFTGDCLYIPAYHNDLPVTSIKANAFKDNASIALIMYLGDCLESIGDYAFYGCNNINYVEINVKKIGDYAFANCTQILIANLYETVEIGRSAFEGCTSLVQLYIYDMAESIGENAFLNCTNLVELMIESIASWCEITFENADSNPLHGQAVLFDMYEGTEITEILIPEGVTSISAYAFCGLKCNSREISITIPSTVKSIGKDAFRTNSVFMYVNFNLPDIASWCDIDFENITANPFCIVGKAMRKISFDGVEATGELVIPSNVTTIKAYAFSEIGKSSPHLARGCKIIIPDNVENIGMGAFRDSMVELVIGNGIKEIGDRAFYRAHLSSTDINLSQAIKIGESAFYNCSSITSINLGNEITEIGKDAFYNCSSLKEVHITDLNTWLNIEFGNEYANPLNNYADLFINGEKLIDLTVPESIYKINSYAFYGCNSLVNIVFSDSLNEVDSTAFAGCYNIKSVNTGNGITNMDFMNNLRNTEHLIMGNGLSFDMLLNLELSLRSLTLPSNTTAIPSNAFKNASIESIEIPESVKYIGAYAFMNCSELHTITIPSSIEEIGEYAFRSSGIKEVYINDIDAWLNIKFENPSSNPLFHSADLYLNGEKVVDFIMPSTVNNLSDFAFAGCNSIESVTVLSAVEICRSAFRNLKALKSVTLGKEIKSIGMIIFYGCDALSEITFTGTTQEWEQITKDEQWNRYATNLTVIHCSDGDINININ